MRVIAAIILFVTATEAWCLPESQPIDSKSSVKDSTISNETEGNLNAINQSRINAGINARNTEISDSEISSKTKGNIKAVNFSDVNTGIRIDDANVKNSQLNSNTDVGRIDANNSKVSTGMELTGAENSKISTNVSAGNIDAKDAVVNLGTVKGDVSDKKITTNVNAGDVSATNEAVNIGNVVIDDKIGSKSKVFQKSPNIDSPSPAPNAGTANIGNVKVESSRVEEVNVTVGEQKGLSGFTDKLRERNQARTFSKDDGVDPSGTKHVYVDDKHRNTSDDDNIDKGNVTIEKGSKVKKVNVYVDE